MRSDKLREEASPNTDCVHVWLVATANVATEHRGH